MADQELQVKITGDASGLTKATTDAARQLDRLQADVQELDAETIEVTPELELSRINRDMAHLGKVLDGLERRKVSPDVDMDITQLLRDEAKVRKTMDELDRRKVEIEASVSTTGMTQFRAAMDDLSTQLPGIGGQVTGLLGSTTKLAPAAGAAAAAFGAWKLGELAADVETTKLQLSALTGSVEEGAQAFDMLQEFAALTPFTFDEVTRAARSLIAAGIDLQELPDTLTDLGNVAAATGTALSDLAVIYQQMLNKGKVSNEEMLQLAERGVPAYQALAEALGLTVPEIQKLAEQGKLGADEVRLLGQELGKLYPTAIQDQAESFNGKWSTLADTTKAIGQDLGRTVLPAMENTVDVLQQLADWAGVAADKMGELREQAEDPGPDPDDSWPMRFGKKLLEIGTWEGPFDPDEIRKDIDELEAEEKGATDAVEDATKAAEAHRRELQRQAKGVADVAARMAELTEDVNASADAYADLLDAFTATDERMIGARSTVYDYQGALDGLRETLAEGDTFAPDAEQGRANWDALVAVAETASDRIQSTLERRGAAAAQAVYQSSRQAMFRLLADAGVKAPQAWNLINQVLRKPHQMSVELNEADVAKAKAKLDRLQRQKVRITTQVAPDPSDPETFRAHMADLQAKLAPVDAKIKATTEGMQASKDELAELANPGGKGRDATIKPQLDPTSTAAAMADLDALSKDRWVTLHVTTVGGANSGTGGVQTPGGGGGNPLLASPTMLTAATAMGAQPAGLQVMGGYTRPARGGGTIRELAPARTPIKVYLDGAEIADHLTLKARRMATTSASARRLA